MYSYELHIYCGKFVVLSTNKTSGICAKSPQSASRTFFAVLLQFIFSWAMSNLCSNYSIAAISCENITFLLIEKCGLILTQR